MDRNVHSPLVKDTADDPGAPVIRETTKKG
jgi:hypothetical protein